MEVRRARPDGYRLHADLCSQGINLGRRLVAGRRSGGEETHVTNMVSRGISPNDILKGIHLSMARRYAKLLRSIGASGDVAITGGLAADIGLTQALEEKFAEENLGMRVHIHPSSTYAGALGAALWGA